MFEIVDEVNVVFQLPRPYVRLLLIACKWDKEKLLERLVILVSDQSRGLVSCDKQILCWGPGGTLQGGSCGVPPKETVATRCQARSQSEYIHMYLFTCLYPLLLVPQTQSTAACGAAALPGQEFICDICMLAYAFEVHTDPIPTYISQ